MAADRARRAHVDRGTDRLRQDARRVPVGHRPAGRPRPRWRARRRDRHRLRVAPESAVERYPAQPRDAASRDRGPREIGGHRPADHSRGRAHRRHAVVRTSGDESPAAAYPRHDAGVALPAADEPEEPPHPEHGARRRRRRDSRARPRQARQPPESQPRTPRRPLRDPAGAHRAVRHTAPDRAHRAVPRRHEEPRPRRIAAVPHHRRRPRPRARPRDRDPAE